MKKIVMAAMALSLLTGTVVFAQDTMSDTMSKKKSKKKKKSASSTMATK